MAKTRIYELAKELELDSKAVLARAQEMGLEVSAASSGLEDADAERLRKDLLKTTKAAGSKSAAKAKSDAKPSAKAKSDAKPPGKAKSDAKPAAGSKKSLGVKVLEKASSPTTGTGPKKESPSKKTEASVATTPSSKTTVGGRPSETVVRSGEKPTSSKAAPEKPTVSKSHSAQQGVTKERERPVASTKAKGSEEPAKTSEPLPPKAKEADESEVGIVSFKSGGSVAEFAEAISRPVSEVVRALMMAGVAAGAGNAMPENQIEPIAESFGILVELDAGKPAVQVTEGPKRPVFDDAEEDLQPRPPVVTVMGHVDHGKTSILDYIRKTSVVSGEKGGITQHIGAYQAKVNSSRITFIDTPGHEAFTAMRARGADVTDIVVLVVAADDGPMPQTVEAISHAKAAGVQMVVAINKCDLPAADPFKVRTMLTQYDVITEELGGDIPALEVSAATGQGIDGLLEVIDLIAQLQEYKANPNARASGVVIESQLDQGMGPTATVIVQRGTLHQGDSIVAGSVSGRVRVMHDHAGQRLEEAGPSTPVLVVGWEEVPDAGDIFEAVDGDREARSIASDRADEIRTKAQEPVSGVDRLQNLLEQLRADETELRIVLKADAHGSVEALREAIAKIKREDAKVEIVHSAVGGINENDVTLAEVTNAVVFGFNVRPDSKARRAAEEKGIEIRTYGIIYEMLEEIELMLVGSLAPESHEVILGSAEVRALFKVPKAGVIAGCYVLEGVIQRSGHARLIRDGVVIHSGMIGSLRRFKDDAREVAQGYECGIGLDGYNDLKEGDIIECFTFREVART